MMNNFGGHGWGMGYGMGWWWIIGLILLVVVVWVVVRNTRQRNISNPGEKQSALEILKERYARGEINKNEFEKMKKDLSD